MFEPKALDSFFRWNFFDNILDQREFFSSYGLKKMHKNIWMNIRNSVPYSSKKERRIAPLQKIQRNSLLVYTTTLPGLKKAEIDILLEKSLHDISENVNYIIRQWLAPVFAV